MIKILQPTSTNTAKTAEIMSKYRPIAPKPETPGNSITEKIKQSPYLRSLWPQLQARPTRNRKRGRSSIPLPLKRHKTHILGSPSLHTFPHTLLPQPSLSNYGHVITEGIDFNTRADIPQEKDLLQQLQRPIDHNHNNSINVITPHPLRPIGSSISVRCMTIISKEPRSLITSEHFSKTPAEVVEKEVESEVLPTVISDSNNQVRIANSAYEEMVGQPECPWLESIVTCGSCKRVSGEVTLRLCDSSSIPVSSNGFTCWVRIDWKIGDKTSSVNAFCDVIRLTCESRDYLFKWRFHTRGHTRQASHSSSNV